METTNVALLVHACDRYELLYRGFEQFFNQHWDFNIRCNLYFATEEIDAQVKGFKNIKSGRGEWSDRLIRLLKNEIREEYVIYMQEDMWLTDPVSADFFNALFKIAADKGYRHIKLHSSDIYQTIETPDFLNGFNIARLDNEKSRYLMSHQLSLWDKQYLLDNLHLNENPWRNERRGTKRLKALNPDIYHIDYFSQNYNPPINHNKPDIQRSNFHTVSINGTLHEEFAEFIHRLDRSTPENRQYADQLVRHFENKLTHDGKSKPRKDDIFKRTKNFFKRLF